jgi:DNA-binding CsgD family transcriptional regulator/tetratricopeptide (TPR) repeat protein
VRTRISSRRLAERDAELEALERALDRAREGDPTVTVLVGEAGIGKTRLVREAEQRARQRELLVLRGECVRLDGGELPYAPLAAALRDAPAPALAAALEEQGAEIRGELERAFPRLGAGLPVLGGSHPDRFAQARLYEALVLLLGALGRGAAVLLVLEDLHWVDRSTRDFVRFLVRGLRNERVAVVSTYRSGELAADHPVREMLAELQYHDRVALLELAPLGRDGIGAQLEGILGRAPDPALLDEVSTRSGGNPLFAEELLSARLAPSGDELPARLADALRVRLRRVREPVRRLLPYAAAIGRPATPPLLAAASGTAEPELSSVLREAVDHHLLVHRHREGTFAFRHDVVREAVYADLLPGERAAIHHAVATALADCAASAELAFHWRAAGRADRAFAASVAAGLEAEDARALAEAHRHYCHALEAWPAGAEPPAPVPLDRVDLLGHASDVAKHTGAHDQAVAWCEQALAVVDGTTDAARAALFFERLGRLQSFEADCGYAAFEEALRLLPEEDRVGRARLLGAAGYALWTMQGLDDARRRCEEALQLAEEAGARPEAAYARMVLGYVVAQAGDPGTGEAHLRRAIGELSGLGRPDDLLYAHLYLAEVLRLQGRFADALAVTEQGEDRARELRMEALFGRFLALNAATDEFLLGRWDRAEERLAAMDTADLEPWNAIARGQVAGQLHLARGRLDEAERELEEARSYCDGAPAECGPAVYAGLIELALWRDRPDEAARRVDEGMALIRGEEELLYGPVLYGMGVRAAAEAALRAEARGDVRERSRGQDAARAVLERLEALVGDAAAGHRPPTAIAHREAARAEAARATGGDTASDWERVAAGWDALGARYSAAYARVRQAEALLRGRGSRSEAARVVQLAHVEAEALGAVLLRGEIERLALRARIEVGARDVEVSGVGETEEPVSLAGLGLTPRELEVLSLVGQGMTNREIADRLFITPKTASLHVSHILAKLGVSNRTMAAEIAHRAGLRARIPA